MPRRFLSTAEVLLLSLIASCGGAGAPQMESSPTGVAGDKAPMNPGVGGQAGSSGTAQMPGASATAGAAASAPMGSAGRSATAGNSQPAASGAAAASPTAGTGQAGVGGMRSESTGGVVAAGSGGPVAGSSTAAGSGGSGQSPGAALGDKQTLIPDPSWDCMMPQGIPGPATGELVFDADMQLGDIHELGETQYGERLQLDIKGGSIKGPKLTATLMDRGLDYQLTLANGAVEVEQINILTVSGGSVLMRTCGTAPGPDGDVRVVVDFEAPNGGTLSWLNTGKFVGTRQFDPAKKTLQLHVFQVSGIVDMTDAVKVSDPAGVPNQTWDCKVASGTKGAEIYRESVGIGGGSVSVGDSKRGTRNIIPITGGTTTGMIQGTVLSGGADFQILANGTFHDLDARYSLKTNEGEIIIVRNCGPIGALVPVFEAKKDGKYAWLNANTWLSSDPGLGLGVVNLTIYKGN